MNAALSSVSSQSGGQTSPTFIAPQQSAPACRKSAGIGVGEFRVSRILGVGCISEVLLVGTDALLNRIASLGPVDCPDRANAWADPADESVMDVPLNSGDVAIIDAEDYPLIKRHVWYMGGNGYPIAIDYFGGKKARLLLHRIILMVSAKPSVTIDHRDGNPLNNRKSNLRICTPKQNCWNSRRPSHNTSGIKGVSKFNATRWRARVVADGKRYDKVFSTAQEAADWVQLTREAVHGEFARHE